MANSEADKSIGNYLLTECRGEDHIAHVCTGIDRATGRKVIVRVVDPLVARNPRVRKLLDEMLSPSSARRVIDPHILTVLDAGVENEKYFIVHEDFGGVPLNEYLQRNRFTTDEKLKLARSILECVRAIHGHRIIHGDLKPQNIFVKHDAGDRPLVKISLSDMAYQASDAMVSIYGELLGTPKYLSPEQIRGERTVEGSDLFSAGIILYELFCEREPFPAQSAVGYLHTNIAAAPRPLPSDVSGDVGKIILRLLASETRNRYRNAQAVLDDLDRVEAGASGGRIEAALPGPDSAFAATSSAPIERATASRVPVILGIVFLAIVLALLIWTLILGARKSGVQPVEPQKEAQPQEPLAQKPPETPKASTAEQLKEAYIEAQQKSTEMVQAGKVSEAVSLWQDFAKHHQKDALAELAEKEASAATLFDEGSALSRQEKTRAQAIDALNGVINKYPDSDWAIRAGRLIPEIILANAKEFEARAEIAKAVETLESLRKEYPGSPAAEDAGKILPGMKLKLAQAAQGVQPEKAISILREVASSNRDSDEAATARKVLAGLLFRHSESAAKQEKYKDALAELREAGSLDSSLRFKVAVAEPELLAQAAVKAKDKQEVIEAVALWKELTQRFPNAPAVKQYEAQMRPLLGAAAEPSAVAAKGSDQAASTLWNLAEQELKNNNFSSAEPYLRKLMKDFPGTPEGEKASDALGLNLYEAAMAKGLAGDMKGQKELLSEVATGKTRLAASASRQLSGIQNTPAGMVYVPAGEATIGLSKERLAQVVKEFGVPSFMVTKWLGAQQPAHQAKTGSYYIDRKPVTNGEYKGFIDATNRMPPDSADWSGKEMKAGRQNYPVTDVTWNDAAAYARWAHKRLPTEVEWEKAARGVDGRLFPWGDKFDQKLAPAGAASTSGVLPVGSVPEAASPYGALDMAGNVKEWTGDDYKPYPNADAEGLGIAENQKAVRGASWDASFPAFCLTTTRTGAAPDTHSPTVGFRCAKDID